MQKNSKEESITPEKFEFWRWLERLSNFKKFTLFTCCLFGLTFLVSWWSVTGEHWQNSYALWSQVWQGTFGIAVSAAGAWVAIILARQALKLAETANSLAEAANLEAKVFNAIEVRRRQHEEEEYAREVRLEFSSINVEFGAVYEELLAVFRQIYFQAGAAAISIFNREFDKITDPFSHSDEEVQITNDSWASVISGQVALEVPVRKLHNLFQSIERTKFVYDVICSDPKTKKAYRWLSHKTAFLLQRELSVTGPKERFGIRLAMASLLVSTAMEGASIQDPEMLLILPLMALFNQSGEETQNDDMEFWKAQDNLKFLDAVDNFLFLFSALKTDKHQLSKLFSLAGKSNVSLKNEVCWSDEDIPVPLRYYEAEGIKWWRVDQLSDMSSVMSEKEAVRLQDFRLKIGYETSPNRGDCREAINYWRGLLKKYGRMFSPTEVEQ